MSFNAPQLADTQVIDPDGNEHRLGDLWADQPHALLFLRHFG